MPHCPVPYNPGEAPGVSSPRTTRSPRPSHRPSPRAPLPSRSSPRDAQLLLPLAPAAAIACCRAAPRLPPVRCSARSRIVAQRATTRTSGRDAPAPAQPCPRPCSLASLPPPMSRLQSPYYAPVATNPLLRLAASRWSSTPALRPAPCSPWPRTACRGRSHPPSRFPHAAPPGSAPPAGRRPRRPSATAPRWPRLASPVGLGPARVRP
nr:vegetative cell wall protein gp1-like [Aegilops tauschii subsp. strangulata]